MILILLLLIIKLIIVLIILIRPLIKIKEEVNRKNWLVGWSLNWIKNNCGPVISINGKQGKGKTLTAVLLAHSKIILLQEELKLRMQKIITNYVNIDFNKFNRSLDEYFSKHKEEYNLDQLYIKLFGNMSGFNYDFLNMRSVKKDLCDYIDFYYILNYRVNYIVSNFYILSRITMTPSKYLNGETLEIKNIWKNFNYILDRALVIVRDEMNVENGNVNSNSKESKENGQKELYSLIRQLYEGLTSIITTKQVNEDEFIGTRRLETTKLDMNSCNEIIYNFSSIQKAIDKWLTFKYWCFTFKYKLRYPIRKSKREEKINEAYLKADNKYRKKEYFWNGVKNFLNAQGLLVIGFDKTEDKTVETDIELFLPLRWGYGTYETHDYACVNKELKNMSNSSFERSESNVRFETPQKIKQKSEFLYANKEKDKETGNKEVIDVW